MKTPFKQTKRSEVDITTIAKKLSQDRLLVDRYRAAIDALPRDKDEWEIDPLDERMVKARAVLSEIHDAIRRMVPGISNNDCLEAGGLFADWALNRKRLD